MDKRGRWYTKKMTVGKATAYARSMAKRGYWPYVGGEVSLSVPDLRPGSMVVLMRPKFYVSEDSTREYAEKRRKQDEREGVAI